MSRHRRECNWPFLLLLLGLFILSATAPRAWRGTVEKARPTPQAVDELAEWIPAAAPPQLAPIPEVVRIAGEEDTEPPLLARVDLPVRREAGFERAVIAQRVAGRPIDVDWRDIYVPEPQLPARGPEPVDPDRDPGAFFGAAPAEDGPWIEGAPPLLPLDGPGGDSAGGERPAVAGVDRWTPPAALLGYLNALAQSPEARPWASDVAELVDKLGAALSSGSGDAAAIVPQLRAMVGLAKPLADELAPAASAAQVRRTAHALSRRLGVWERLATNAPADPAEPDAQSLRACLAKLEAITRMSPAGQTWRKYLGLDDLWRLAERPDSIAPDRRRAFTAGVLFRMTRVPMTPAQQQFMLSPPMLDLREELRTWAAEPLDAAALLRDLEELEASTSTAAAQRLADRCWRLVWSPLDGDRSLGRKLESTYRNANFRVVVSEALLNRLVPDQEQRCEWVRERVLGKPVEGRTCHEADVDVRLVPDARRLRMAMEVRGDVTATTSTDGGPARFLNNSRSTYTARKEFEFGLRGIQAFPTTVDVQSRTDLRAVETDFDGVPLVNLLVQGVARSQHEEHLPEALREVRAKTAAHIRRQADAESDARIRRANAALRSRVLEPLAELSLVPAVISAETSDQRLTTRLRIAGADQLGGYTPRPRALAGSLASVQIHQSALNNAIRGLELEGQTFTYDGLMEHVAARLRRPDVAETEWDRDDVYIGFAERDAASVEFQDGQAVVTLRIRELIKGGRRWHDLWVQAVYRPEADGLRAGLVRDGVISLRGDNLRMGSQIALRGVFSKMFSKNDAWPLTPEPMVRDPRLAGLHVTQLVLEDGWLGFSLGQGNTSRPLELARRGRP